MLLLLLWLLPVHSTEPPQTVRKPIQVCPSVGYFFERQGPESACYLCYCKGDNDAVCILRDSERCNAENYSYHTDVEETVRKHRRRKHRRRSRRSAGLMDLFFKESKKEELMKSMVESSGEACKPKASKSIGCPPKDWCEGCLVCDCDDEGQWQCHVMSFCDDKPPKPKPMVLNLKKGNTDITADHNKNEEQTTKRIPLKKNGKQVVKQKRRFKKKTTTTAGPTINTTSTRKPETIKLKPKKPVEPLISVKTKRTFRLRKDKKRRNGTNNDVLVIKKYISTLAPITDLELLKYKNDSRKLAQILYQQYESSTKQANPVKREIRSEPKVGGKMLLTREFTKANKLNHDTASSKNMGDKIFTMKQKSTFKYNNNARGRKPINVKEHYERKSKIRAEKEKRKKKSLNSFYSTQKKLVESYGNIVKRKQKKSTSDRRDSVKVLNRMIRNKRDIQLSSEATGNSTKMDNDTVNASSVNSDPVSEIPGTMCTNNEDSTLNLNNYIYTLDTQNYNSKGITTIDMGYETTSSNVDIITIGGYEKENLSFPGAVNYTMVEDTTTENPNEVTHNLQMQNLTYNNVSEESTENQYSLPNNYSLETTIIIDLLHNKQLESKQSLTTETTTLMETTGTEVIGSKIMQYSVTNDPKSNTQINSTETTTLMETTGTAVIKNETKQYTVTKDPKYNTEMNNTNTKTIIIKKTQLIDRIINDYNKCKLKKWIKMNNSKGNGNNNITSGLSYTLENNYTKTDFDTVLQSFTNNTKNSSKNKRIMAIKYLKKLYSKLLSNKNNQTLLTNVAVMESICDTFGPCKISTSSVEAINSKITELIAETKKALNIISVIKGLLESIDNGNNITASTNGEVEFKSYVKKLNAILTDSWVTPLNETQRAKMKIIKTNTKVFIHSIGKFAVILNDILKIIRLDKSKYESMRRGKILLNRVSRQKSIGEPLHKIKKLFLKYNILQNTFMRNMYQAISDLEQQNNFNTMAVEQSRYDPNDRTYKMSVNKYMNKITYNLKKLKEIAMTMNPKERVKRGAMRDNDAVDYLLTLMEYLLKKNNPLDNPPVTDGIDLLIDAIRRAPDIKPLKKKILYHSTTTPSYFVNDLSKSSSESEEENLSVFKNHTENFKDMSFEKPLLNETEILRPIVDNEIEDYKTTTDEPKKTFVADTTTKYIDVEDMVFNGDNIPKVYIATFPPDDNTEEPYFVKETPKPAKKKKLKSSKKYSLPRVEINEESTFILSNTTDVEVQPKNDVNPFTVKSNDKTQFDLLNEEYERRLKKKTPTPKAVKIKHKKAKRPKKKSKLPTGTDVSSISREVDEERTRKDVVAEEDMLRTHMINSIDYDPFKSMGEESISRDLSPLDGVNNEALPGFFT